MCCRCERCEDPTDLGSYGNAFLCGQCKVNTPTPRPPPHLAAVQGPVLPQREDDTHWKCEKCPFTIKSTQIKDVIQLIDDDKNEILANPKKKKIRKIEKTIKKWEGILDPRNLLITRLKYNLVKKSLNIFNIQLTNSPKCVTNISNKHIN